jgi:MFS family permease
MASKNQEVLKILKQVSGSPLLVFSICMIGLTLTNFDQSLFSYAIPGIMRTYNVGLDAIGSILSVSFIFAAITTITIGVAADRFGRRRLFIVCLASSAFLVSIHALAPTVISLTILRACAFGLSAGILPLANAFTAETAPARVRGLLTSLLQCGYPLGWFLAALIGAPILDIYGWQYIFLPALIVVPLTFIISRYLPESRRFTEMQGIQKKNQESIWKLSGWLDKIRILWEPKLKRRTIWCILLFFFQGGAYAGTAFYFPTFFSEVHGYSEREAAEIVGLSYGIGAIGYIIVAVVGEFLITRRNTVLICMCIGTIAFCGLIWVPTTYSENVIWFSAMAMTFYAVASAMWAFAAELFPTRARATASAIMLASVLISFATYPVGVAVLVEVTSWKVAFTWAAIPSAIIATFSAAMLPNLKSGLDIDDIAT